MSLFDIYVIKKNFFYSKRGEWYVKQKFFQEDKVKTRWYMIRKSPVPESTYKNWEEQQVLISKTQTVPNATEFAWAIMVYKAVRGTYLFNEISVRTLSLDFYDNHISVGSFRNKGLLITNSWDTECSKFIGLSIARKR